MFFYSIVGIGESFLKLGVALWMIHTSGDRLITYSVLMAFIPILSMTIMRIYCRIHYAECRVSIRAYYDKKTAKDIISFAGWNLMGNASGSLGNYGNMIAMNHYWGTGMNTVMGIANQLQGQLMVLSSGMLKALNPIIAKKEGRGDSQSMLDYAIRGCELSFFLLALAAVPFYIYTPLILQAWLGDFPDWTVLFVRLQLIRALLEQLTASLNKALEAKNRIVILNLSTFILNLVTVPILCFVYNIGLQPYWHYIIAIPFMVIIPSIIKIELCCRYCGLSGLDILKNLIIPISKYLICIIVPIIIVNNLFTHGASQCVLILIINLFIILVVVYQSLDSSMRSTIKTFLNSLVIR
jgi:O-antigen/teichoic acid export membrane protein